MILYYPMPTDTAALTAAGRASHTRLNRSRDMSEQRIRKRYVKVKMGEQTQIVREDVAKRLKGGAWYRDPVARDPRFFSPLEVIPIPDPEQATDPAEPKKK